MSVTSLDQGHVILAPANEHLFRVVNEWAADTRWLHAPVLDFARYGVVLFAALLLAGWWLARSVTKVDRLRRLGVPGRYAAITAALWAPAATLIAVALNQPLVNGFAEPRPYTVLPHALDLIAPSHDFSFPSDHSVMAGAAAAGLVLLARRLSTTSKGTAAALLAGLTMLAALGMAFARVYVAAHFPLDVVAGLAVGALVSTIGYLLLRRPLERVVGYLASVSPPRLQGFLGAAR